MNKPHRKPTLAELNRSFGFFLYWHNDKWQAKKPSSYSFAYELRTDTLLIWSATSWIQAVWDLSAPMVQGELFE